MARVATLTKWLSVRLGTKLLQVRIPLQSLETFFQLMSIMIIKSRFTLPAIEKDIFFDHLKISTSAFALASALASALAFKYKDCLKEQYKFPLESKVNSLYFCQRSHFH